MVIYQPICCLEISPPLGPQWIYPPTCPGEVPESCPVTSGNNEKGGIKVRKTIKTETELGIARKVEPELGTMLNVESVLVTTT